MYLSRLNLFGFKSFAQKTEIQFHDGITVIVGPNGCGKSNIVDAIRWVLGEQKAGVLRSDNMQNVIFNGTRTQKPLGMAEVSITILNNRQVLPIEYTEVAITRRLFRSGESQYLLNNSLCRLKDIVDLFMDTGVGTNAYSVIELSMVEKILNGKPDERRQIFEEAAGVTKYKIRRRAAFRKLEATEQDLIRLSDIISEVEKSTNSLRRQVQKARRYRDINEELRQLELDYSAYHLRKIRAELQPLISDSKEKGRQREKIASHLASEEAQIEESQLQLLEIERQLNARRNDLMANAQRIQHKEEEILVSQERVRAANQAKERAKKDIEDLTARVKTLTLEKEETHQALATAESELDAAQVRLQTAQGELQIIQENFAEKRQKGQKLEQDRLKRLEKRGEIRKEQERLKTQLEYSTNQLNALHEEAQRIGKRRADAQAKISEISAQKEILQVRLEEMEQKITAIHQDIKKLREAIDTKRNQLLQIQGQIQTKRERATLLRKFIETYEDYPEGVRHLLLEDPIAGGCHGTVGDMLSVDDRYRKAVEVALGEAAVALIVKGADQAMTAIETLKSTGKGAVTFLPLENFASANATGNGINPRVKTMQGFIASAAELVTVSPEFEPILQALLENVVIAKDLPSAIALANELQASKAAVVTLNGEVAYSWGAIRGGESKDAEASLVGRRAIIETLENDIVALENQLAEVRNDLQTHENRLQAFMGKDEKIAEEKSETLKRFQSMEVALGAAQVELQRANERLENLEEEGQILQEQIAGISTQAKELQPVFAELEKQKQEFEQRYEAYIAEARALEVQLKQMEERVQSIHLDFATKKAENKNYQMTLERILKTEREIEQAIQRRTEEIRTAAETIEDLNSRIEALREQLQDDFAERKELEDVIDEIEKRYRSRKEEIENRDKALRKVRNQRDEISEQLHEMEMCISKLQMNEKNLLDHIREVYEINLVDHPVPEEIDTEFAGQRINELKQKLRNIGPVNMLALKDYEVEKERLDFLLSQKEDLLKAEANLKETIKVINNTAYERFNIVFSKVRENFIQVFRSFFDRGIADLRLDGDDPLEAEIVIEASPKGKRVGSLALLSGGEKALTAISLLFAIYLVKPSPFCIFDEVDAPLDDANVHRFNNALKKFSNKTQFIVVTHNKLTMGVANQLYGITMEEPGISKVVSVRFEKQEEEPPEKAAQANA